MNRMSSFETVSSFAGRSPSDVGMAEVSPHHANHTITGIMDADIFQRIGGLSDQAPVSNMSPVSEVQTAVVDTTEPVEFMSLGTKWMSDGGMAANDISAIIAQVANVPPIPAGPGGQGRLLKGGGKLKIKGRHNTKTGPKAKPLPKKKVAMKTGKPKAKPSPKKKVAMKTGGPKAKLSPKKKVAMKTHMADIQRKTGVRRPRLKAKTTPPKQTNLRRWLKPIDPVPPGYYLGCTKCRYMQYGCTRCRTKQGLELNTIDGRWVWTREVD